MAFTKEEQKEIDDEVERRLEADRKTRIILFEKDFGEFVIPLFRDHIQVAIFLDELKKSDPDNPKWSKIQNDSQKFAIDKAKRKSFMKDGNLDSALRTLYEKKYDIFDKKNPYRSPRCQMCGNPIESLKNKYCSTKCKRRNKAKGIQKTIEIHTHCVICSKSLEGKRAGTKTCSMRCRKQLSLKKVIV